MDSSSLGSGWGGDETSFCGLLNGLAQVVPDGGADCFPLYVRPGASVPPAVLARADTFPLREMPWTHGAYRYAVTLPSRVRRDPVRPELLYTVTWAPLLSPVPVVQHVHDLSFHHHPTYYPRRMRFKLNVGVPLLARRARAIMTPSEFCRRDLIATYGLAPERVFVVPNAIVQSPALPELSEVEQSAWMAGYGIRGPYFVYVGNLHPRKNLPRLIEAFVRARQARAELADHQLVIVGARWWAGGGEERAKQHAPAGSVILTGRVPDADRDRLVRGARALVYPSLFEGFGLPVLEAMAVGTPVLTSNTSALPEVAGDAALLVDPLDVDALAAGIVQLATDPGLRNMLRLRGPRRAAYYDARRMGERALEAFSWALHHGGVRHIGPAAAAADTRAG